LRLDQLGQAGFGNQRRDLVPIGRKERVRFSGDRPLTIQQQM
jgi:hypothetical protein